MKQNDVAYPAPGAQFFSHVRPLGARAARLQRKPHTHRRVLPQFAALEDTAADTLRVGTKRVFSADSIRAFQTATGIVQGMHAQHCTFVHRGDGHGYYRSRASCPDLQSGVSALGVL